MFRWTLALAALVLVAGCSVPGTTSVDAPTATVEPGESGTVAIHAEHVSTLRVGETRSGPVRIDWANVSVSPPADAVYQSLPPTWTRPRDVTLTLAYDVTANATAGERSFTVTATAGDDGDGNETVANVTFVVE